MTTIFERVNTALDTINPAVPYSLAPYKSTATLPDVYMAYQVINSSPETHADDEEQERSYLVQISIYKKSGLIALPDVDTAMLAAGFQKGPFRQLPKAVGAEHYGLAKDYTYLETKE